MDEKRKLLGNFEKILKFFDENSIEKVNFLIFYFNYLFFRKFVTKNRAFGNNIIFLHQFSFGFEEGGFPAFPLATPLIEKDAVKLPNLGKFLNNLTDFSGKVIKYSRISKNSIR